MTIGLLGVPPADAIRLLRMDPWPNANMLAQELFTMLTKPQPAVLQGPVTVKTPNSQVPLFQVPVENGQTVFQFTRQGEPVGSLTFQDGILQPTTPPPAPAAGASIFPATVLGGSGSVYSVELSTGAIVTAIAWPAISSSDGLDLGTQVWVFKIGSVYYLDAPVWL